MLAFSSQKNAFRWLARMLSQRSAITAPSLTRIPVVRSGHWWMSSRPCRGRSVSLPPCFPDHLPNRCNRCCLCRDACPMPVRLMRGRAIYWEQKSMQTIRDADYTEALQRFVRRAIDSGRGLDERDGDGRTALHWAAANGHQVCVCYSSPRRVRARSRTHAQTTQPIKYGLAQLLES